MFAPVLAGGGIPRSSGNGLLTTREHRRTVCGAATHRCSTIAPILGDITNSVPQRSSSACHLHTKEKGSSKTTATCASTVVAARRDACEGQRARAAARTKQENTAVPLSARTSMTLVSGSGRAPTRITGIYNDKRITGTSRISTDRSISARSTTAPCTRSARSIFTTSVASVGLTKHETSQASDVSFEDIKIEVTEPDVRLRNPQLVAEYASDINRLLDRTERIRMPKSDYMDFQPEINSKMRAILVDWLVEIHLKYKMKRETLFLAVNIVDRYLGLTAVSRRKLQLIGVGGMMIAAKFEEIRPPDAKDYVYMADGAYSKEEVLQTEVAMLIAMRFDLCVPTASHYLDRYLQATICSEAHAFLLQYLLELALLDYRMVRYPPSYQVAAATFVTNMLLKINPSWPSVIVRHTAAAEEAIQDCASRLFSRFESASESSVQAVRWKYSQHKFGAVAKITY